MSSTNMSKMSKEDEARPSTKEFFELDRENAGILCEFTENLLDKTFLSLESNYNNVHTVLCVKCIGELQPIHKQFLRDYREIQYEHYERLRKHFCKYSRDSNHHRPSGRSKDKIYHVKQDDAPRNEVERNEVERNEVVPSMPVQPSQDNPPPIKKKIRIERGMLIR